MSETIRVDIQLHVSQATLTTIDRIARERSLPRTGLVLQALGILHIMHDAAKDGLFVGTSDERSRLNTVLVAPLI